MYTISKLITDTIVRYGIRPQSSYDRCFYGLQLFFTSTATTLVIMLIGLLSQQLPRTLVYIAVYWSIHSIAESYHCREFYQCFVLTTAIYSGMVLIAVFANDQTQYALSWMLLASTTAVLLAQILNKEIFRVLSRKQLLMYGATMFLALFFLTIHIIWVAFPLVYGMFVINIMQAKVRGKNE